MPTARRDRNRSQRVPPCATGVVRASPGVGGYRPLVAEPPRHLGSHLRQHGVRGRGAERIPATSRYGVVLLLLFLTFVFMASGASGGWARVVTVGLQGLTLLAAMEAAGARRHVVRVVLLVVVLAFVAALVSLLFNSSRNGDGVFFALNGLLVAAAPVVIAVSIVRRGVIDLQTVLGAICIYVLIGMLAAFVYAAMSDLSTTQFFAQTSHPNTSDFLYFSFVTLTTVGYGDLTVAASSGIGRAAAILEALVGQLYLVTVVALVVGRLGGRRNPQPDA